jgi:aerobic carbon-monoxide dehydrogenase large subunit
VNPDGTWNVAMKTPMGNQEAKLQLEAAAGALSGRMSGPQGEEDIQDGVVNGNALSWSVKLTKPMKMTLKFTVDVDGDNMTGKVKLGPMGSGEVTGTRA